VATAELSADAAPAAGATARARAQGWPRTLALLALFVLLVGTALLWVYRPLLSGGFFLSDDHFLLREATAATWRPWPSDPWLLTGVRHAEMWRPLGLLTWRLSHLVSGQDARAFYALDLALHLANAGLTLLLARRLGLGALPSLVAGAVFALHPIAVESVGWLAARFDLQATLFALVALHCHLAARRRAAWRPVELLAFAAALLSKESTIVLPLVALALDLYLAGRSTAAGPADGPGDASAPRGEGADQQTEHVADRTGAATAGRPRPRALWRHVSAAWPLWTLAVAYVPLRLALLGTLGSYGDYLAPTPAALLENLLHHARMLLFVPYDADAYVTPNLYQPPGLRSWRVLAPLGGALLLAIVWPGVRLGLAIALAGLLPVLTISGGGRLVYFALIGVALAAGALLAALPAALRSGRAARLSAPLALASLLAALALLASYAQTARLRATAWADAGRLVRGLPALARDLYPALPAGARVYVRGLPDHDREVYALRNVAALHFDVDAERDAPPLVDATAWASPRLGALVPVGDFPATLPPEQVCRARFAQLERGALAWQPVPLAPSPSCAPLDDPLPAAAVATPYRFGDALRLAAYAVPSGAARPGDTLRLDLLWRADSAPGRAYKIFVHVVAADGRPVAQRDAEPYDGRHPTAAWVPGTTLRDRHPIRLPADLPPGQYGLLVGWYGLEDPARLPAFDGDRPIGDAVRLKTIEVRSP
jgi:hypothetical protein